MLRFEGVSFRYAEDHTDMMKNLSFTVEDGAFAAIIGASGCGKSTIFRLINGLEKPDSGKIYKDDTPVQNLQRYSAFMPQKDMLFPWRTIEENVALPLELLRTDKKERKEKTETVLAQVGLSDYRNKYPKELSGGMRQRVAFARTLLSGADMLLLDEPFSALDYLTRVEMQEWLLRQWEQTGKTVLFITHDVEEAIFLAKTVYIIRERPFSEMERVDIPLDYPRMREDLKHPDIVELKEAMIRKLRGSVTL